MTDARTEEPKTAEDAVADAGQKPSLSAGTRRPYQAPRLVHLGSVRELTWGATNGVDDNAGFQPL